MDWADKMAVEIVMKSQPLLDADWEDRFLLGTYIAYVLRKVKSDTIKETIALFKEHGMELKLIQE